MEQKAVHLGVFFNYLAGRSLEIAVLEEQPL